MNQTLLIKLVSERPELWDRYNNNYHQRELKNERWREVAQTMGMHEGEIRAKWTNMRDVFRRELKKTLRGNKGTQWVYFDKLMFLKKTMQVDDVLSVKIENPATEIAGEDSVGSYPPPSETEYLDMSREGDDQDDYHFAMSLVPSMKDVPRNRKLHMRMKILQILAEEVSSF